MPALVGAQTFTAVAAKLQCLKVPPEETSYNTNNNLSLCKTSKLPAQEKKSASSQLRHTLKTHTRTRTLSHSTKPTLDVKLIAANPLRHRSKPQKFLCIDAYTHITYTGLQVLVTGRFPEERHLQLHRDDLIHAQVRGSRTSYSMAHHGFLAGGGQRMQLAHNTAQGAARPSISCCQAYTLYAPPGIGLPCAWRCLNTSRAVSFFACLCATAGVVQ